MINLTSILPESIAHMRSSRKSCLSDLTDHLPLLDSGSFLYAWRKSVHVQVLSLIDVVMTDLHIFAIVLGVSSYLNHTISHGIDGRAYGSSVICTQMGYGPLLDRMKSSRIVT